MTSVCRNSYIFNQENALENAVWKKATILTRPQYFNVDLMEQDFVNIVSVYASSPIGVESALNQCCYAVDWTLRNKLVKC